VEELVAYLVQFVNVPHALALNGLGAFLKMIFYNLFHRPALTDTIPGLLVVAGLLAAWLNPGSEGPIVVRGLANAGLAILLYEMVRKMKKPGAITREERKSQE
jgi:hypothetical protein